MKKKIMLAATIALTAVAGLFLCLVMETDQIYTHLFYLPIALTALILPELTIIVGAAFACFHLLLEQAFHHKITMIVMIRGGVIFMVSLVLRQFGFVQAAYQAKINALSYTNSYDAMTKVHSRSYFDRLLNSELQRPTAVFVCDIDNLKQINDTLGHSAGDRAIIQTAKLLTENIRHEDKLSRTGGDEFVIIAPNCDHEQAEHICCRIKKGLQSFNEGATTDNLLSFSIGFAICDEAEVLRNSLRQADAYMYEEKSHKKIPNRP